MSRLDDLSRTSPVQPSSPTAAATQRALEPENTPPETANALTRITVQQLYVFLWKLFAAALLFSLPFLLMYLIIAAIAH